MPESRILRAALVSALSLQRHRWQQKTAWPSRFCFPVWPHWWQRWEVNLAGTYITLLSQAASAAGSGVATSSGGW